MYYLDKTHVHFGQINKSNSLNNFLLILGSNFLVDLIRKHLDPTLFFSSPPPSQTPSKRFSSSVSLTFYPSSLESILPNTPILLFNVVHIIPSYCVFKGPKNDIIIFVFFSFLNF